MTFEKSGCKSSSVQCTGVGLIVFSHSKALSASSEEECNSTRQCRHEIDRRVFRWLQLGQPRDFLWSWCVRVRPVMPPPIMTTFINGIKDKIWDGVTGYFSFRCVLDYLCQTVNQRAEKLLFARHFGGRFLPNEASACSKTAPIFFLREWLLISDHGTVEAHKVPTPKAHFHRQLLR